MKRMFLILVSLLLVASMLISCGGKTPSGDAAADPTKVPAAEPTAEITTEPTPEATPAPVMIFTAMPEDSIGWQFVDQGVIMYDGNLVMADLDSSEFDGSVLPCMICIDHVEDALRNEITWSAKKILWEPAYSDFAFERCDWAEKRMRNMTDEEKALLENASYDEKFEYFSEIFEEDWRSSHTPEECDALDDTVRRYEEATEKADRLLERGEDGEYGEEFRQMYEEHMQKELERLESSGIIMIGFGDGEGIYALIPIEQIRNFPENRRYGYRILWFNESVKDHAPWAQLMKEHGYEELIENAKSIL
ncbi:MAG: PT domain-containing protein [Clostridia bacterium]|nr:PT domain-containing protein [Clostridia bacterium]